MSGVTNFTDNQIECLQASFHRLEDDLTDIVSDLYPTYFSRYPRYAEYFRDTDFREQRKGVELFFRKAIPNLENPESLKSILEQLARVHQEHDVPSEAYERMGEVFLDLLKKYSGDAWDEEIKLVWFGLWETLSESFQNGS